MLKSINEQTGFVINNNLVIALKTELIVEGYLQVMKRTQRGYPPRIWKEGLQEVLGSRVFPDI